MKTISIRDIQKQVTTLSLAEKFFESSVLFALSPLGRCSTYRGRSPRPAVSSPVAASLTESSSSRRTAWTTSPVRRSTRSSFPTRCT